MPPTTTLELTDDLLLRAADPVAAALDHVSATALTEDSRGRVGLELELHLVDRASPARRPAWDEVRRLLAQLPAMPMGSAITVEPGGQVELSTPPGDDVALAVAALALDLARLRTAVGDHGFGLAALGADPARPSRRINPAPRYRAMEQHFDALGCVGAGLAMMTSTAALQVNLDAGPRTGWDERLRHVRSLVPVLVALSSTSPWLGGESNGWHSMRQGVWQGIDRGRTDPCTGEDPAAGWAEYALDAPVMLVLDDGVPQPVTRRIPFRDWLAGTADLPRRPALADLEQHLTTLFPPVRQRGYLELRGMDAMPSRWWPAMAAVAVTLVDDPVAAQAAREHYEPLGEGDTRAWERATRDGLADPGVRRAALGCLEVAARHVTRELRYEVEGLLGLVDAGSSPAEQLRLRIEEVGPAAALLEASDD